MWSFAEPEDDVSLTVELYIALDNLGRFIQSII